MQCYLKKTLFVIVTLVFINAVIFNYFFSPQILEHNSSSYWFENGTLRYTDLLNGILHESKNVSEDVLLNIVRDVFIKGPPPFNKKYSFDKNPLENINGQIGVPPIVDKILGKKQKGFFIEAGAHDGEHLSNTLFFELKRNYTGLLIEPSSKFNTLIQRNRRAKCLNVCLATKPFPHEVDFLDCDEIGGIKGEIKGWAAEKVSTTATIIKATCIPLYTILSAVGNPTVDYFSLDIEGVELAVLKTIPWDNVDIKVLSIQVGENGRDPIELNKFMLTSGYTLVIEMLRNLDNIYVRNDLRSPIFGHDQKPRLMKTWYYMDIWGSLFKWPVNRSQIKVGLA